MRISIKSAPARGAMTPEQVVQFREIARNGGYKTIPAPPDYGRPSGNIMEMAVLTHDS